MWRGWRYGYFLQWAKVDGYPWNPVRLHGDMRMRSEGAHCKEKNTHPANHCQVLRVNVLLLSSYSRDEHLIKTRRHVIVFLCKTEFLKSFVSIRQFLHSTLFAASKKGKQDSLQVKSRRTGGGNAQTSLFKGVRISTDTETPLFKAGTSLQSHAVSNNSSQGHESISRARGRGEKERGASSPLR